MLGINSKQSILRFLIIIMYLQYVSIMVIAHVQWDWFFKGFMALSGILLVLFLYNLCVKFQMEFYLLMCSSAKFQIGWSQLTFCQNFAHILEKYGSHLLFLKMTDGAFSLFIPKKQLKNPGFDLCLLHVKSFVILFNFALFFLGKGSFNNYVEKMRGRRGKKMSVFVHA